MTDIDGFMQRRHNSSALAIQLYLSCINPSINDRLGQDEFICFFNSELDTP